MNIPFDDPRMRQVEFAVVKRKCLSMLCDAPLVHPAWSEKVEIRSTIDDAQHIQSLIESRIRDLWPTQVADNEHNRRATCWTTYAVE